MRLETTTYSASNGYTWSSIPCSMSIRKLNQFYRMISSARGAFPDPRITEIGLVSDGTVAACFTIQNIEGWDSEKRASDYAAFAFFRADEAQQIDFLHLVSNEFFWSPTHTPPTTMEYDGPVSAIAPKSAFRHLQVTRKYLLRNPRCIGAILQELREHSTRWVCLMKTENILKIECNNWTKSKGTQS